MGSKKTLPMKRPPITAYGEQANILSIILNYEKSLPWIYNSFIHTEVYKNGNDEETKVHFFDFLCGFINTNSVPFGIMQKGWDNLIDFLIECIDQGYYVQFTIDRYYIPNYDKNNHSSHKILVFGYDMEKKEFDIADNFKMGVYGFEKCTFSQLEQAYKSGLEGNITVKKHIFYLLNFNEKYNYDFNLQFYIDCLEQYISSKNVARIYKKQFMLYKKHWKYGMATHEFLHDEIDRIIKKQKFHGIRSFHMLLDHKSIMLDGIKYMGENNILNNYETYYNDYSKVKEKAKAVRNRIIKYGVALDNKILEKAKEILHEIEKEEKIILKLIVEELKS